MTALLDRRLLVSAQLIVGAGLTVLATISDVSDLARLVGAALAVLVSAVLIVASATDRIAPRGIGALVGGMLGVIAGGGVAPAWIATSGPSAIALVMAASLVAGALLLVTGAWLLIRAVHGWWRLLAIPVAFVVLELALIPLTTAVYATHPPRTPLDAARPSLAQDVSFVTADGAQLRAWYTPSGNGAAVIVLPGSGGAKGSTLAHANVLVEHGYGVLALDSRGSGESDGGGNAWGWHGVEDIAAAAAWLVGRPEVDPGRIGALGLSMGGEEAITAAAAPDARLAAVVAEGVSARVPGDLDYLPTDPAGLMQRVMAHIMWTVGDFMTAAHAPWPLRDALAQAPGMPMLIIAGSDADEAAAALLLQQARPSVQLWTLADTPHISSLALHPAAWERHVIGFLEAAMPAGPVPALPPGGPAD